MIIDLDKIKQQKSIQELLEFSIIIFDKPAGMTSHDVCQMVEMALGLRKASHFGTLDLQVTGVLPIALNRGCKLTGDFIGHDKTYTGVMQFHAPILRKDVEEMIRKKFLGKITQKPPVRSSVKRVEREREVKRFEILEQNGKDFTFIAEVQGGTYIRKLIDDLGIALGITAHMISLRRIQAGIFLEQDKRFTTKEQFFKAVKAWKEGEDELLREILIPAEIVSELYPVVQLKKEFVSKVLLGLPPRKEMFVKFPDLDKGERIVIFCGEKFIETATIIKEGKNFVKPEFVLQPFSALKKQ